MSHKAIAISAFVVSACSFGTAPEETVGHRDEGLLLFYSNPLAGKPMSGTWRTTSGNDTDPAVSRGCSYTIAYDAAPGPRAAVYDYSG
jgi:hypothetical protein